MNPNNTREYRRLERKALEEYGAQKNYTPKSSIIAILGFGIAIATVTAYINVTTDYKTNPSNSLIQKNNTQISKDSLEHKIGSQTIKK